MQIGDKGIDVVDKFGHQFKLYAVNKGSVIQQNRTAGLGENNNNLQTEFSINK